MKYLVRISKLEEKVNNIENELSNIEDKINKLRQVMLELNWEGDARVTFDEVYDEYLFDLEDMEKKLVSCLEFLLSYCNRYGEEYSSLRKKIKDILLMEENYGNN